MEASSVNIGGKAVKRITLGGEVLWEGGKRYAYYFNGTTSSWARATAKNLTETSEVGLSISIDFRFVKSGGRLMNYIVGANEIRFVYAVGSNHNGYLEFKIPFTTKRLLADWRMVKEKCLRLTVDGEYVADLERDYFLVSLGSCFGCLKNGAEHAKCYIYGVAVNDEWFNLEDLPGVEFHNVIRYELDRNGEIIESTATTLNT